MLSHRLRRSANIKTALVRCLVFAGSAVPKLLYITDATSLIMVFIGGQRILREAKSEAKFCEKMIYKYSWTVYTDLL